MPETDTTTISGLFPCTTASAEETLTLGARVAKIVGPGTVLALYGDLGSGKTHFVKGVARGLGLSSTDVRSPTFTILSVHDGGERPLYHFDAYRVQHPDEFVELGFEDYVHGDGLTCIEWAGRVREMLPPDAISLQFHHVAPSKRRVTLGALGASDDDR